MARIISVHGTFAQWEIDPASALEGEPAPQWWEANSDFRKDVATFVEASDGELAFEALEWTSENSVQDRREAARRLYARMMELEGDGDPYCVVGHSHGGTIIASALMQAASKKQSLPGLRRWISVGTPFLDMKPEKFLFSRLPLVLKAAFVASMMLFVMFAIASAADIYDGIMPWRDNEALTWFAVSLT
ncbi:MAG: alpha/beta hydrolase, partial [Pseudomonadota bacterium]